MRETVCELTNWRILRFQADPGDRGGCRQSGSGSALDVWGRFSAVCRVTSQAAGLMLDTVPRGFFPPAAHRRAAWPRVRVRQIAAGLQCACLSVCVTAVKDWWRCAPSAEGSSAKRGVKKWREIKITLCTSVSSMSDFNARNPAAEAIANPLSSLHPGTWCHMSMSRHSSCSCCSAQRREAALVVRGSFQYLLISGLSRLRNTLQQAECLVHPTPGTPNQILQIRYCYTNRANTIRLKTKKKPAP